MNDRAEFKKGSAIGLALRKLTPRLLLRFGAGIIVLAFLSAAWLRVPDSHLWQFVFSIVSAVVLVCAALGVVARTMAELRGVTLRWPRMFSLLLFFAAAILIVKVIMIGRLHEDLYAGYWNSKMPSHGRGFITTFEHFVKLQDWFYDLIEWVAFALLVPLAMETVASGLGNSFGRKVRGVYRQWLFWLLTIGIGVAIFRLTELLANWTPGRGVAVEMVSMGLRLGFAYIMDLLLVAFVLALTGVYLERAAANTPTS